MSYIDDLIEHKSLMEGQKTRVVNQIITILQSILPNIYGLSAAANSTNINKIVKEAQAIIDEAFSQLTPELQKEIMELGVYEAQVQEALLNNLIEDSSKIAIAGVGKETLKTAIFKTPIQGLLFKDGLKNASLDVKKQVETAVRIAVLEGATASQAKARIKANYNIAEKRMVTYIRTAIQNATNVATAETYKANNIEKYKYVAILDSRTTDICKSLNGTIFELGKGRLPPVHYNCRSFTIPVFKGIKLGDELDGNYAAWLQNSKKKGLTANEKGDFVESSKNIITLDKLKTKEEHILVGDKK